MSLAARARRIGAALCALIASGISGTVIGDEDSCIGEALRTAPETTTIGEIRLTCAAASTPDALTAGSRSGPAVQSVIGQRLALERYSRNNPFVLTAHRPNYVLPLTYVKLSRREDSLLDRDSIEIQFQLSQKVLLMEGVFGDHGHLSAAYTNRSFWQAYSDDASSPFRETNHEPELILSFEHSWTIFGFRNAANQFSLNHQSNGRSGADSRSWNRIILNMIFERENFIFTLRPWYRLPEDRKDSPDDMRGDDNPRIERYLGYFEWYGAWMRGPNLYSVTLRNNLRDDNRGSIDLSWSFPIYRNIKGTVRYFNGYGESLINYNRSSESLGVGFLISDWL